MVEPHFSMLWNQDIPRVEEVDAAGRTTTVTLVAGRLGDRKAPPPPPHSWATRAEAEDLMRRLRHDTQRPLLQVADPLQKLREMHAARDPLYREVAHFTVDTGRPTVSTLVNMIVMQLELAGVISQG